MVTDLPLPVATLLRRATNAKSPKDRHDTAYYAWEVSIRLAVAFRPPADRSRLARGSVGVWVGALDPHDGLLTDAALLQTFALFSEVGQDKRATPKSISATKLLSPLPAYRNRVIGHGSTRTTEFYSRSAETLLSGLKAAWKSGVFLPEGARLVFAESVELDPEGDRRARLLELSGDAGHLLDVRGTSGVPDDMLPHRLYAKEGSAYRSLHPWALFREEEVRERVFFFNGIGRRAEVLDYASGDTLKGAGLEAIFAGVEQDIFALFEQQPQAEEEAAEEDANRFGGYRILGKLGEGGMGVVYLAEQESLGRRVALKMLPRDLAEDAVALARFRREVAALSRCDHPHVVKVLTSGETRGVPYYAMEYVEGADLSQVAKMLATSDDFHEAVSTASERQREANAELFEGVPDVPRVSAKPTSVRSKDRYRQLAEALRDAALGVHHLHEAGVVHRDLKPGNLMVTASDRRVVVMDLGLAMVGDASRSITRDKSQLLGTLRYMPPEQLQRTLLQLDRRADVYSLGATFYELLTGRPFFDGESEERLIVQVLR